MHRADHCAGDVRCRDSRAMARPSREVIRVHLVSVPRMQAEMLQRAIATQDDMKVVRHPILGRLAAAMTGRRHEVVITGIDEEEAWRDLVDDADRHKVLRIGGRGVRACLYQLRPERTPLGRLTPDEIVEAIRSAVLVPEPIGSRVGAG
jgi:hypothetical protein